MTECGAGASAISSLFGTDGAMTYTATTPKLAYDLYPLSGSRWNLVGANDAAGKPIPAHTTRQGTLPGFGDIAEDNTFCMRAIVVVAMCMAGITWSRGRKDLDAPGIVCAFHDPDRWLYVTEVILVTGFPLYRISSHNCYVSK